MDVLCVKHDVQAAFCIREQPNKTAVSDSLKPEKQPALLMQRQFCFLICLYVQPPDSRSHRKGHGKTGAAALTTEHGVSPPYPL